MNSTRNVSPPDSSPIPRWLLLSILVAVLWGVWGALMEFPEKRFSPGFPPTLGYVVWTLTMVPCAAIALERTGWRLDRSGRAIWYGALVGLSGSAGQLVLFHALQIGPAYLIFPVISLAPVVTILLSVVLLGERANRIAEAGVVLALAAIVLLSIQGPTPEGAIMRCGWVAGALAILVMWGGQAYLMKSSAGAISEESLFVYMAASGLVLAPAALLMTDFTAPINWGLTGPWLSALIQLPNAIGALLVIYAMRSGKAMIVSPAINGLYPVITMVLSLALHRRIPEPWNTLGMLLAVAAVLMMSYGEALNSADPLRESGWEGQGSQDPPRPRNRR